MVWWHLTAFHLISCGYRNSLSAPAPPPPWPLFKNLKHVFWRNREWKGWCWHLVAVREFGWWQNRLPEEQTLKRCWIFLPPVAFVAPHQLSYWSFEISDHHFSKAWLNNLPPIPFFPSLPHFSIGSYCEYSVANGNVQPYHPSFLPSLLLKALENQSLTPSGKEGLKNGPTFSGAIINYTKKISLAYQAIWTVHLFEILIFFPLMQVSGGKLVTSIDSGF